MTSSDQEFFNQISAQDTSPGKPASSSNCPLVSDKAIVAAGLRRYLKREGLTLARELERAVAKMNADLCNLQGDLEADVFSKAHQEIEEQRRRIAETIRNILAT
jgi:hypothetical protein